MSGSKKKAMIGGGGGGTSDRYMDSWSKAGKPTTGLDRTDDHFLDQHGWGTDSGGGMAVIVDFGYKDTALPDHLGSFYRPVASRHGAYEYCQDWQALSSRQEDGGDSHSSSRNSAKKDKSKKSSKTKR